MRNIGFALSQKMLPLCIFLCIYIPQTRSTKYCKIQGSTLSHVGKNNVHWIAYLQSLTLDPHYPETRQMEGLAPFTYTVKLIKSWVHWPSKGKRDKHISNGAGIRTPLPHQHGQKRSIPHVSSTNFLESW